MNWSDDDTLCPRCNARLSGEGECMGGCGYATADEYEDSVWDLIEDDPEYEA
jgi:hypothetical protein